MQTEYLVEVNVFCTNHNIEVSFISSLEKTGLIQIKTIKETEFIDASQLKQLEKYIRFFYDLDINMEGIETVNHLLDRMNRLQEENIALKNKLRLYEFD